MLNAAVVGLGVGAQHARVYASSPLCKLRWVYDLDVERMGSLVRELGAGAAASSFESILSDPSLDVVSIATYDSMHFEQVVSAFQAGKHVFCEKPLCRTLDQVLAVERAWRSRPGLHLASNLVLRSAPLYRWLKEAISSGELGEIYAIDGEYLYGRLQKITDGWRAHEPDYSVMLGGGVHMVDLMLWLTGQRPRQVSAVGNAICTRGTQFARRDFVAATFGFESGLVGRITANFGCVHRHHHVLRVYGTRATVLYDDRGARIHRTRDPERSAEPIQQSPLPASKGELIPDFLTDIVEQKDPTLKGQHELDVIAACVAADDALERAQPIGIQYP